MRRMMLVFWRDYREISSTAAFRIITGAAGVITIGASAGISVALLRQSWYGEPAVRPILELIMGLVVYFLPLFLLITFIWAFSSLPIIKEKVNGNIECLLATPLSPKAIWIGKGLAIFLPGYTIAVISSAIVLIVVNLAVILPGWGNLIVPGPALVNGLVINPLLFLALLLFIIIFTLANNPDMAIAPSFLIGFGLMIGVPVCLLTGAVEVFSWIFDLWYLAGTLVAMIIVLYLSSKLTRENIVLSSKGS